MVGASRARRSEQERLAAALALLKWVALVWALLALELVPACMASRAGRREERLLLWREGLELASYVSPLLRGEGREPDGGRRYDRGGGRRSWHIGRPNDWTALRFLVRRFSGEAASGQGRVREGHCGWGSVPWDFLASGLRPRASVVVVCGVGVVVDTANLASGFRPCASEVL